MLKFTYTETGSFLEYVADLLEDLVAARADLTMRVGERLTVEPGAVSLLMSANLSGLEILRTIGARQGDLVCLSQVDADCVELSLQGTWLSHSVDGSAGVFLIDLGEPVERLILNLWREEFSHISPVC